MKYITIDAETNEGAVDRELTKVHCIGYKLSDSTQTHILTDGYKEVLQALIDDGYVPIMHNASFDLYVLRWLGVKVGVFHDTMLIHYLLYPFHNHSLADIGVELDFPKLQFKDFDSGYSEEMGTYCKRDVEICEKAFYKYYSILKSDSALLNLYYQVELPLVNVLISTECNGVAVNVDDWESINRGVVEQKQQIEATIQDEYPFIVPLGKRSKTKNPRPDENVSDVPCLGKWYPIELKDGYYHWQEWVQFSPSSNTHVKYVFGELGIELKSTDKKSLKEVGHPLAKLILDYRKVAKLSSTYGDSMLERVREGRLHGSYNQCVTLTGRLSSSRPNLQNIPSHGESGDTLRKLFVAEKGNKLVSIDVDSFQMRIYAWYLNYFCSEFEDSNALFNDFNNNPDADPHQAKADLMGVSRRVGKTLNFATLFGQSPANAANLAGCTTEEMEAFFDLQESKFPSDKALKSKVINLCKENGGVLYDLYGRRGYYPDILEKSWAKKGRAERQAFNFLIQGTEASIIKLMFAEAFYRLEGVAKPVMTVHDEFSFECAEENAEKVAEVLNDIVNRDTWLPTLKVTGTASIGDNWYEVH